MPSVLHISTAAVHGSPPRDSDAAAVGGVVHLVSSGTEQGTSDLVGFAAALAPYNAALYGAAESEFAWVALGGLDQSLSDDGHQLEELLEEPRSESLERLLASLATFPQAEEDEHGGLDGLDDLEQQYDEAEDTSLFSTPEPPLPRRTPLGTVQPVGRGVAGDLTRTDPTGMHVPAPLFKCIS